MGRPDQGQRGAGGLRRDESTPGGWGERRENHQRRAPSLPPTTVFAGLTLPTSGGHLAELMMAGGGSRQHEYNDPSEKVACRKESSMDAALTARVPAPAASRPWYTILYVQVLIAIVAGVALGYYY